jgi:hypothetical protein
MYNIVLDIKEFFTHWVSSQRGQDARLHGMARLVLQTKSDGEVDRSNNKGLQLHYIKSDNFYYERCTPREQTYSNHVDISPTP